MADYSCQGAAGTVVGRKLTSLMTRRKFNPQDRTDRGIKPHATMPTSGEFACIDGFVTKYYKHFFLRVVHSTTPNDFAKSGTSGPLSNCLGYFNWETREQDI